MTSQHGIQPPGRRPAVDHQPPTAGRPATAVVVEKTQKPRLGQRRYQIEGSVGCSRNARWPEVPWAAASRDAQSSLAC